MARIAGINLPNNKRVVIGLTAIYGIGPNAAHKILETTDINENTRVADLSEEEESTLRQIIGKHYRVEGELRREIAQNIRLLQDTGAYRGTRHRRNLPVRGQRTKTNSRTVRGNVRRTMGSGKIKTAGKT